MLKTVIFIVHYIWLQRIVYCKKKTTVRKFQEFLRCFKMLFSYGEDTSLMLLSDVQIKIIYTVVGKIIRTLISIFTS